jgi:hypothetical protein
MENLISSPDIGFYSTAKFQDISDIPDIPEFIQILMPD